MERIAAWNGCNRYWTAARYPFWLLFCLVGRLPYRQRRISRQSAFIGKNIENRQRRFFNGLLYTFGRAVAYTALGIVLLVVLQSGSSLFGIQKFVGKYGEMPLGPALLLVGVCMLVGNRLDLPKFGFKGNGDGFGHQGFPFLNIVRGIDVQSFREYYVPTGE